jgi:hypothetical protein
VGVNNAHTEINQPIIVGQLTKSRNGQPLEYDIYNFYLRGSSERRSILPGEITRGNKLVTASNRQSAARSSWLPTAHRGPAAPGWGGLCTLLRARIAWRPCLRLAAAYELWVSVRRVEAAEDLAAEGLHPSLHQSDDCRRARGLGISVPPVLLATADDVME